MAEEARLAGEFVQQKIACLCEIRNDSMVRAEFARLRRGIGKAPGSIPETWKATLENLPDELQGKDKTPSRGEWAVYTALTLFALHQQGSNLQEHCMNRKGMSLGTAVRMLVQGDEDEQRIKRRFDKVATASDLKELTHHLRGLVQLLKMDGIPLDYPAIAEDVYRFQLKEQRDSLRLAWGRAFYRWLKDDVGGTAVKEANKKGNSNISEVTNLGRDENDNE